MARGKLPASASALKSRPDVKAMAHSLSTAQAGVQKGRSAALGSAALALAIGAAEPAAAADIEFGRYLATECLTCHRNTVGGAIPNIFGMSATTFGEVVRAYRAQRLPNQVMQTIASRLKDDEIDALAADFEVTKRP